jgi:tetratricopeptide (TPR) repeat protein
MRRQATVVVSFFAFLMALTWPYASRAQDLPQASGQPPPPPPPPQQMGDEALAQAKQHFEAGKNAYNAGDYPTAIREFKAAEALRPSPLLAYNIGLANEKLGKKRVAVKYYKRYLEQLPTAANRAEVEGRISGLEREIAAQPPPPAPPGETQPPPPTAEQPADNPPPPPAQPGYSSYDPYASTAPPPNMPPPPPAKKKSYWWVWLIVAGGVTLVAVIAVVAYLEVTAVSSVTTTADHAILTNPRNPAVYERQTPSMVPIFHF